MIEQLLERQAVALEKIAEAIFKMEVNLNPQAFKNLQPVKKEEVKTTGVDAAPLVEEPKEAYNRDAIISQLTANNVKFDAKQSTKYLYGLLERKLSNKDKGMVPVEEASVVAPIAKKEVEKISQQATAQLEREIKQFPEGSESPQESFLETTPEPSVENYSVEDTKLAAANFINKYGQTLGNKIFVKYGARVGQLTQDQRNGLVNELTAYAKANPK